MNKWQWICFVYPVLHYATCGGPPSSQQNIVNVGSGFFHREDPHGRISWRVKSALARGNNPRKRMIRSPMSLSNVMHIGNGEDEITESEISVSGPRVAWNVNAKSDLRRSPTWYNYNYVVMPSREPMISHIMKYSADPIGYSKTFVSAMKQAVGLPTDDPLPNSFSVPSFGTTIQLEPGNDYHWSTELNVQQSHQGSKTYKLPIDGGVNVATAPAVYAYRYAVKPDDWTKLSPILPSSSQLANGLI
uniref:Uncharacterized protein n=1 Tax=Trichuris muris TaxID=70415 RepID=A0A5S6QET0_TRIMR